MSTAMLAFLSSCGAENQLSRANLPIPAHIPRVIERSFLILEAILLRSHGIDPMTEKALSKVRIDCKDSPYLPRVERLCKWVNRKSFICILHASGLLSQTGVVRQQNNQVLSVSSSSLSLTSRGQKRSLDTMESSECDVISRTDLSSEDARSMILAAKVFANLHRVIASFL